MGDIIFHPKIATNKSQGKTNTGLQAAKDNFRA
jgi:hypothetical protein